MTKHSLFAALMMLAPLLTKAQTGTGTAMGISHTGLSPDVGFRTPGLSTTPKCPVAGGCSGLCPVFIFIGDGDWRIAGNWKGQVAPPEFIQPCYQIVIDPVINGFAFINIPTLFARDSRLTVMPGKKLVVMQALIIGE